MKANVPTAETKLAATKVARKAAALGAFGAWKRITALDDILKGDAAPEFWGDKSTKIQQFTLWEPESRNYEYKSLFRIGKKKRRRGHGIPEDA